MTALPRFRQQLQVSERKVLLALGDLAMLSLGLFFVLAVRLQAAFETTPAVRRATWFVLLAAAWAVAGTLAEVYDLRRAAKLGVGPLRAAAAVLAADAIYLAIPYVTPYLHASRLTIVLFALATGGLVALWRVLYAAVLVQPSFRHPVLILGAGPPGREILAAMRSYGSTEYLPVGFVDDDPALVGKEVDGLEVLGHHRELHRVLERTGASEVVVAIPAGAPSTGQLFQALVDSHERGIAVTPMHRLFEALTGQVPVEHAGRNLAVVLPLDRPPPVLFDSFKRVTDVLMATAGLLLTLVVTPLAAVGLWLEDRGPVFYRQRRVGQAGRQFEILKFRTMVEHAEINGPQWAAVGDPRVTWTGRILRRLHLDELPQAWNILKGDMSVIGPRPERPEFVEALQAAIPFYRTRLSVRPGVTGWAQVNFEYGDSIEDALIKLRYDLYYIKHRSLLLELTILVRTLGHVFRRGGR
ncbi:MAG: sugar transferase [Armatimonadota bacterium]|nr:sugar transferase [Armatimonadota bacterium]